LFGQNVTFAKEKERWEVSMGKRNLRQIQKNLLEFTSLVDEQEFSLVVRNSIENFGDALLSNASLCTAREIFLQEF